MACVELLRGVPAKGPVTPGVWTYIPPDKDANSGVEAFMILTQRQ